MAAPPRVSSVRRTLCLLASPAAAGPATAHAEVVPLANLRKTLIHEDTRLGLIQGLVQLPGADAIAVFGYSGRCLLMMAGDRAICSPVLPDGLPPVSIGTFVTDHHIAADFDADGTPERLLPLERAGFKLETAAGTEVARSALERYWAGSEFRYWFEPAVTWSQPRFVLVSVDATILVLDARLQEVRTLPVPGMESPMHVSAGAPLGGVEPGPFASIVGGRGQVWSTLSSSLRSVSSPSCPQRHSMPTTSIIKATALTLLTETTAPATSDQESPAGRPSVLAYFDSRQLRNSCVSLRGGKFRAAPLADPPDSPPGAP